MSKIDNQPGSKPMKLGKHTGSVMNLIMSSCCNTPEVGKGATELMWSDRHAYEVLEVSKDYKDVVIQRYKPERIDDNGMSDSQEYAYKTLEGPKIELRWLWGSYRRKSWSSGWDKKNNCWYPKAQERWDKRKAENPKFKIPKPFSWEPINIIFGYKEEFYDFSF